MLKKCYHIIHTTIYDNTFLTFCPKTETPAYFDFKQVFYHLCTIQRLSSESVLDQRKSTKNDGVNPKVTSTSIDVIDCLSNGQS